MAATLAAPGASPSGEALLGVLLPAGAPAWLPLPGVPTGELHLGRARHPGLRPHAWWLPGGLASLAPPGHRAPWLAGLHAALTVLDSPSDFLVVGPPPAPLPAQALHAFEAATLSRVLVVEGEGLLGGRSLPAAALVARQVALDPVHVDHHGLSGLVLAGVRPAPGSPRPGHAHLQLRGGRLHLARPRSLASEAPWWSADLGWLHGRIHQRFLGVFQAFLFRRNVPETRDALRLAIRREAEHLVTDGLLCRMGSEPCGLSLDDLDHATLRARIWFRPVGLVSALDLNFTGICRPEPACAHQAPSPPSKESRS